MSGPASMTPQRRFVLRLILLLFPLLVLAAVEGAARIYFWTTHGVPGHRYGTSQYDPVMGAFPRPNSYGTHVQLNDFAFRNTEDVLDPKPAGSLRVIAYGGSTVFCHQLSNEQAWPIRLQDFLREARPHTRDQVLNGGVIMWSLGHVLERARRDVPRLRPDAVIIYAGVNELTNAHYLANAGVRMADLVARGDYGRFTTDLAFATPFRDVITYKFVRDRVFAGMQKALRSAETSAPTRDADPAVMENYLATLRELIDLLIAHDVRPIFVREVFNPEGPGQAYNRLATAYSAAAAPLVEAWGATLVDPTGAFADPVSAATGLFQASGVHLTTRGADLLASVILDEAFRSQ